MTNIIAFPEKVKKEADIVVTKSLQKPVRMKGFKTFVRWMLRFFQALIILSWPILRWFVYLDLLLVFLKMVVHSSPHAGMVFALHCGVILIAAFFVAFYRAKTD